MLKFFRIGKGELFYNVVDYFTQSFVSLKIFEQISFSNMM